MTSRGPYRPESRSLFGTARTCLVIALALLLVSGAASCRTYDRRWSSSICIKNYEAGAAVTESYSNAENLRMATQTRSQSAQAGCPIGNVTPAGISDTYLEASLNASVLGVGLVGWESVEPLPGPTGRHSTLSQRIDSLAGIFSVETFVQLFPNTTAGETSVAWLPCA